MDESCVLLVNLHQLLISFVPHAGLWVCSHCNEVGYTLHRQDENNVMFTYICHDHSVNPTMRSLNGSI